MRLDHWPVILGDALLGACIGCLAAIAMLFVGDVTGVQLFSFLGPGPTILCFMAIGFLILGVVTYGQTRAAQSAAGSG